MSASSKAENRKPLAFFPREEWWGPLSIHNGRQRLLTQSNGTDENEWDYRIWDVGPFEKVSGAPAPARDAGNWGDAGHVARLGDGPGDGRFAPTRG
jgi:hypothetical protein